MNFADEKIIDEAWSKISKFKTVGIVASIIMILFGLCLFFRPFQSEVFMILFVVIGTLINGISKVFLYFKTDKAARDGWTIAIGILWIVISIFLLSSLAFTIGSMAMMAGIMMGVTAIFDGVADFCNLKAAAAMGRSKGLMILAGVLDIICGMIIIAHPIMSTIAIVWFYGIFITILGITFLIRCLSIKKA